MSDFILLYNQRIALADGFAAVVCFVLFVLRLFFHLGEKQFSHVYTSMEVEIAGVGVYFIHIQCYSKGLI